MIDNVAFHLSAQGRGFCRFLMEFVERDARAQNLKTLELYKNEKM